MPPVKAPSMLDSFLQQAGLARTYGPQDDTEAYMGMPPELPVQQGMAPPLINRGAPGISVPNAYGDEEYSGPIDEEVMAEVEQPVDTMEAFRQNVLNPPKRTRMTYPKNTLAGLDAALKIAAEPSPLEKNRVWVNGVAHQKQQVRIDPVTGEKQFITNVHEPSFGSQVMRAMPASISPAIDILNQPREDAVADWEMQNKALKEAAGAESAIALAKQREAQAGYTGQRAGLEQQKIDISKMTADEKARVSRLNTLTDAEKIKELQAGRISLAELQAAEALKRVNVQQAGATQRTGMQQAGATQRTGMQQAGATQRTGMQQTGATERTGMQQTGANQRNAATIAGAAARNEAAIEGRLKLKQTPSSGANSTSQLPTQQIKAAQLRAGQAVQDHPEWEDYLSVDQNGMVHIDAPSTSWYDAGPDQDTYNEIKSYLREGMPAATTAAPPAKPTTTTPPAAPSSTAATTTKPPTATKNTSTPPKAPDTSPKKQTGKVRVQAPGGQTGTWDLSKGPIPSGFKKIG